MLLNGNGVKFMDRITPTYLLKNLNLVTFSIEEFKTLKDIEDQF